MFTMRLLWIRRLCNGRFADFYQLNGKSATKSPLFYLCWQITPFNRASLPWNWDGDSNGQIILVVHITVTALFFLLLNKTKFNTWSLHSENRCKSILEQQIEFHLQKSISLAVFLTKSSVQVWISAVFERKWLVVEFSFGR